MSTWYSATFFSPAMSTGCKYGMYLNRVSPRVVAMYPIAMKASFWGDGKSHKSRGREEEER